MAHNDIWGRTVEVRPPQYPYVKYIYDAADRLTQVDKVDASMTTVTTIDYDYASRKLSMDDADMGLWTYNYNALGELTRQVDARGKAVCFYYDSLGRMKGKHYPTGACPEAPTNVLYTYDATTSGNEGLGLRTGMSDASGSTTWKYDTRARLIQELKTINPHAAFTTSWTYNSADMPVTMTYPSLEVVNFTYLSQGTIASVIGDATYLASAAYDAAGRVEGMTLGSGGNVLTLDYTYFAWQTQNGLGRLAEIKLTYNTTTLQNLYYGQNITTPGYDAAGNVTRIENRWDTPSAQIQTFTYDFLNRLKTAEAVNGLGAYSQETYNYDSQGRITSLGSLTPYVYNDPDNFHAATGAGSNTYSYDLNGNMLTRNITGDGNYSFTYDQENRLVDVYKNVTTHLMVLVYDGDGNRVKAVDYVANETTYYVGSYFEVTVAGTGAMSIPQPVVRAPYPVIELTAEGARANFQATAAFLEHVGQAFNSIGDAVRSVGQFLVELFIPRPALAASPESTEEIRLRAAEALSTTLLTNQPPAGEQWRSYYYAGAQRIAMRTQDQTYPAGQVYYLFGDHLGSTSLTVSTTGSIVSQLRYKPWGEIRYTSGTAQTDFTFTGQRSNVADFGLMYYVARWYDPALGRFTSADTIVPGAGNPGAWDRYAYVLNNPIGYTDPGGHDPWWCNTSTCIFNYYSSMKSRTSAGTPTVTPPPTPKPSTTASPTTTSASATSSATSAPTNTPIPSITPTVYNPALLPTNTISGETAFEALSRITQVILKEWDILDPNPGFLPPDYDPLDVLLRDPGLQKYWWVQALLILLGSAQSARDWLESLPCCEQNIYLDDEGNPIPVPPPPQQNPALPPPFVPPPPPAIPL